MSIRRAGPVIRDQDLFPDGYPYHPDWGTDWRDVDEVANRIDSTDLAGVHGRCYNPRNDQGASAV